MPTPTKAEQLFTEIYERMGQRGLADTQNKLNEYRKALTQELLSEPEVLVSVDEESPSPSPKTE